MDNGNRRRNIFFFNLIAVVAILYLGTTIMIGTNNFEENDYFKTEEYANFYVNRVEGFLIIEEELVEKYYAHIGEGSSQDSGEDILFRLQALQQEKYLFYRRYYRAPAGFTNFHGDSYLHSLNGYNSISRVIEYRFAETHEDKETYLRSREDFFHFLDRSSMLKNRFEESVKVYEINLSEEGDLRDSLELELEKDSSE